MKRLVILAVLAFGVIGCSAKIKIPPGTPVQYENRFTGAMVVVENPLAGTIITRLNDEPDRATKGMAMGLDTQKYLRVGTNTFQVTGDELVLLDDWGVRTWVIRNIEMKLDVATNKAPDQPGAAVLTPEDLVSAETIEELAFADIFGTDWKIYEVDGMQILVGLLELPSDGESYIDVFGYVYNRHYEEWRRFCLVKTYGVYLATIQVDEDEGTIFLIGGANNEFKGKRLFQIDIGVLSDDRSYTKENTAPSDPLDKK